MKLVVLFHDYDTALSWSSAQTAACNRLSLSQLMWRRQVKTQMSPKSNCMGEEDNEADEEGNEADEVAEKDEDEDAAAGEQDNEADESAQSKPTISTANGTVLAQTNTILKFRAKRSYRRARARGRGRAVVRASWSFRRRRR